jgi:23S rRNA pseudouridine1911/1915/1917 synthase
MSPRPTLRVIYEDNHLLAVAKPAGLATMGLAADRTSLVTLARDYLKHKYRKPGNVYLGVVSRLDAPVTGVVLFARTSKAAARLTEQFRSGAVRKTYWAVVERAPRPVADRCRHWLLKDDRAHRVRIVEQGTRGAKEARLRYRTLATASKGTLLEVILETGRKHQIRVQLAERGSPILGDAKYGARASFAGGLALHARSLELEHPVQRNPLRLVAPLPVSWKDMGIAENE